MRILLHLQRLLQRLALRLSYHYYLREVGYFIMQHLLLLEDWLILLDQLRLVVRLRVVSEVHLLQLLAMFEKLVWHFTSLHHHLQLLHRIKSLRQVLHSCHKQSMLLLLYSLGNLILPIF